jgi:hypothetical protein
VDGKQYTTTKADNCYYLDITGITPDMLSHTYSISVSDKDGNTKTLNYSVLTYVKSVTENGNYPESLTAVAKALYYYNKAAVDYIS